MALVVEDGTGKTNADSYISLADANTYVTNHGADSAWTAATDAAKESALQLATQYIDLKYGPKFKSRKTNINSGARQALEFPRLCVIDNDGYQYSDNEIPPCLKNAVVEAALRIIAGDKLLDVIDTGTIASESNTIGPISESITYIGGKAPQNIYPKIDAMLKALINDDESKMSRG